MKTRPNYPTRRDHLIPNIAFDRLIVCDRKESSFSFFFFIKNLYKMLDPRKLITLQEDNSSLDEKNAKSTQRYYCRTRHPLVLHWTTYVFLWRNIWTFFILKTIRMYWQWQWPYIPFHSSCTSDLIPPKNYRYEK